MNLNSKKVLNSMINGALSAAVEVGRAGLHALGPDNFEYYMCSLQLLSSAGDTEAYMIFPVMPNNLVENKTQIATINKTAKGVVTVFNSTFNPIDISLQGTFGRKFRLILGQKEFREEEGNWFSGAMNGNMGFEIAGTEVLIKTGYGLIRMLRNILDATYKLDSSGNPRILIFNNYSLNTSYIVEPLQFSFQQSTENNMMWFYNVEMKAVADSSVETSANAKTSMGQMVGAVAVGTISKFLENVISDCMKMIPLG